MVDGEPADAGTGPTPDARSTSLRLARVHLRMGSLALARAELESFAGRGLLDEDALLDLAEVRWRTGDIGGAGEAANALLALGREDGLALVIAAEGIAALGRPGEARRLAARAMAALGDDVAGLDTLFAGMPRSVIWPESAPSDAAQVAVDAAPAAPHPAHARLPAPPPARAEDDTPASPAAAEALAGGLAALGGGDPAQAALHLGVALRLEPAFADAVLDAIGEQADERHLALVAGDAYRLLGRESEALAAFDRARGHLAAHRDTRDEPEPGSPEDA